MIYAQSILLDLVGPSRPCFDRDPIVKVWVCILLIFESLPCPPPSSVFRQSREEFHWTEGSHGCKKRVDEIPVNEESSSRGKEREEARDRTEVGDNDIERCANMHVRMCTCDTRQEDGGGKDGTGTSRPRSCEGRKDSRFLRGE